MYRYRSHRLFHPPPRFVAIVVVVALVGTFVIPPSTLHAQGVPFLPEAGVMVPLSPAFRPAILLGLRVDPNDPFKLNFLINKEDNNVIDERTFKDEADRLIKYFGSSDFFVGKK